MRRVRALRERPDIYSANYLGAFDATDGQRAYVVIAAAPQLRCTGDVGERIEEALEDEAQSLEPGVLSYVGLVDVDGETTGLAFDPFEGDSLRTTIEQAPVAPLRIARFGVAMADALSLDAAPHPDWNLLLASDGTWRRVPRLQRARAFEEPHFTAEQYRWLVGVEAPERMAYSMPHDELTGAFFLASVLHQLATGSKPGGIGNVFAMPMELMALATRGCADADAVEHTMLRMAIGLGLAPRDERATLVELRDVLSRIRQ